MSLLDGLRVHACLICSCASRFWLRVCGHRRMEVQQHPGSFALESGNSARDIVFQEDDGHISSRCALQLSPFVVRS